MSDLGGGSWLELVQRRWAIPALAELQRTGGCKFVTLVHGVGAGRSAVRDALDRLIELGLAEPNPGYGHPLRPEYLVAARGVRVAEGCAGVWEAARRVGATEVAFQKWTLPMVLALAEGTLRYGELSVALAPITPRALSLALRRAERAGLVERSAAGGFPPATYYRLTEGSLGLVEPLSELVRAWGSSTRFDASRPGVVASGGGSAGLGLD